MDVHQHMGVILIPIMLSTWIRNLKYLVPLSSLANFLVIAGYVATMYIMCHDLPSIDDRRYIADWHDLPLFFGTVIYSFEGITLVSVRVHRLHVVLRIYVTTHKFGNRTLCLSLIRNNRELAVVDFNEINVSTVLFKAELRRTELF